jgi:hypothetical protein
MHIVLPQSLLDRLLYHDMVVQATLQTRGIDHLHELRSLDYLFYTSAAIGVLQIIEVRVFWPEKRMSIYHGRSIFLAARRITQHHTQLVWRGTIQRV